MRSSRRSSEVSTTLCRFTGNSFSVPQPSPSDVMRGLSGRPRRRTTISLGGLGIHPERLPMMSVEIVETPTVHEPVVLRLHGVLTAGRDGLLHQFGDFPPALARERKQSLGVPARV